MEKKCENCRWFLANVARDSQGLTLGECRCAAAVLFRMLVINDATCERWEEHS